jgi:exosome complex component RRP42
MINTKEQIMTLLNKEARLDNRKLDEYRKPITIETNVSPKAEGSAKVTIGETIVVAGVKMDVGTPYSDNPDQGNLMVNAELLPLSSPDFESGPPSIGSIELARVVDRGIRESKCIDLQKLCIKKEEKVWNIFLDIYPLNNAGNLFDAAALAALAALKDAKIPEYDEKKERVEYGKKTKKNVPLAKIPISCTILKIDDKLIVDPTDEEEKFMDARLTVATLDNGEICALQKGGKASLSLEDIKSMVDIALKKNKELNKLL